MMKKFLQNYFSLSEKGARNTITASFSSFLKYFSYVLPPTLVFVFLNDLLQGTLRPGRIYLALLAGIVVLMFVLIGREYTCTYDVTYEESANMRIELANKLKELPLSYFSTHNLTDLSQSVMMDVNNIEMAMSHAIPEGIGFAFFFFVLTILFCKNNFILGLCVTLPIWLAIGLMFASRRNQTEETTKYYHQLMENSDTFQQAFEMQQEIKSYSMQEAVGKDVFHKLEDTEKVHIKSEMIMAAYATSIGIMPYFAPVLTAIIGMGMYSRGELPLLYFIGYLIAATNISHQFAATSEFLLMIFFFGDSFKHIRDLKNEPIQEGEDRNLSSFDITFDNVEFAYGEAKVLDGISFTAKQGEVTAIVGPSGCGKTTVLRVLSRLYDYDKGSITIGGDDIKKISTKSLYDCVSIVFQNVELFNTSVLENIRLGRKGATDDEVIEAARMANVDEIIRNLPDGYNTRIGENGSKLSGGERQRISIARAFLKNAPIILLDEISASLDVENEMDIQNSLNHLIKDKTVIVVSHRLKSIEKADQILVMNSGRKEAVGTHEELMKTCPLYQSMVEKSRMTDEYVY